MCGSWLARADRLRGIIKACYGLDRATSCLEAVTRVINTRFVRQRKVYQQTMAFTGLLPAVDVIRLSMVNSAGLKYLSLPWNMQIPTGTMTAFLRNLEEILLDCGLACPVPEAWEADSSQVDRYRRLAATFQFLLARVPRGQDRELWFARWRQGNLEAKTDTADLFHRPPQMVGHPEWQNIFYAVPSHIRCILLYLGYFEPCLHDLAYLVGLSPEWGQLVAAIPAEHPWRAFGPCRVLYECTRRCREHLLRRHRDRPDDRPPGDAE